MLLCKLYIRVHFKTFICALKSKSEAFCVESYAPEMLVPNFAIAVQGIFGAAIPHATQAAGVSLVIQLHP